MGILPHLTSEQCVFSHFLNNIIYKLPVPRRDWNVYPYLLIPDWSYTIPVTIIMLSLYLAIQHSEVIPFHSCDRKFNFGITVGTLLPRLHTFYRITLKIISRRMQGLKAISLICVVFSIRDRKRPPHEITWVRTKDRMSDW